MQLTEWVHLPKVFSTESLNWQYTKNIKLSSVSFDTEMCLLQAQTTSELGKKNKPPVLGNTPVLQIPTKQTLWREMKSHLNEHSGFPNMKGSSRYSSFSLSSHGPRSAHRRPATPRRASPCLFQTAAAEEGRGYITPQGRGGSGSAPPLRADCDVSARPLG